MAAGGRYARQTVYENIGEKGQAALSNSGVVIIGMGALGTVTANNLCRAGVGRIRMADRDYVELTNLQRQILFDEEDARQRLPKSIAAYNRLSKANSEIILEPVVTDVNPGNIMNLIQEADLAIDATDNMEIRLLLNEACDKAGIPWIYGAALGSRGTVFCVVDGGPCLACVMGESGAGPPYACNTRGVLNSLTGVVASIQSNEAVKILTGSGSVCRDMLFVDMWENAFDSIRPEKNDECPVCVGKRYLRLDAGSGAYASRVCGDGSIQVAPPKPVKADFADLAERLSMAGEVRYNPYTLYFSDGMYEIVLFQDGRAIIKNALDENNARSVYTGYFGI